MSRLLVNIFNFIVNLYTLFYFGLFITDYNFLFKSSMSNISGFTVLLLFFLSVSWLLHKEMFMRLLIVRAYNRISKLNDKTVLWVIFTLIFSAICALGIVRHLSFSSAAWDMGIIEQALWNTLHGDIFFCSIRGNMNLLGDHFEPILFLLLPFYALWQSVFNLIIIQAFLLAAAVFPLYLIAREKLSRRFLIFALVVSYALAKGIRGVGLSDFHLESFMLPLSFWAFYLLLKKRYLLFSLSILLLLCVKETAVFMVLGLGIYALFFLKRRLAGLSLVGAAVFFWIAGTRFFVPLFNNSGEFIYSMRFPFGVTYGENIRYIISHPFKAVGFLFMPKKIEYCLRLAAQVGFTAFFAPREYILIIAPLLCILGSAYLEGYYLLGSHYVAQVLPFVYIGAVYGLARLEGFVKKRAGAAFARKFVFFLAVYLLTASLFSYGKTDAYKFNKFARSIKKNRSFEKLSYLSLLPPDATVSATSNIIPHICHRKYIYEWSPESELALKAEYIVIDLDFQEYLSKGARDKIPEFFSRAQDLGMKKIFFDRRGSFLIFFNPRADKKFIMNFRGNLGL